MERPAAKIDAYSCVSATTRAAKRVQDAEKLAKALREDPDIERRMARHFCAPCHYIPRIGGAAMTTRPCGLCGTTHTYTSTDTDVLCTKCASEHSLCAHCGGDIILRERRRQWPSSQEVK